ncbi:hypothetical protein JCM10212_001801 [Sporobolomyces blumeae]
MPTGSDSGGEYDWASSLSTSMSMGGGGRVEGSFLTEPGSYEDFVYPSAFSHVFSPPSDLHADPATTYSTRTPWFPSLSFSPPPPASLGAAPPHGLATSYSSYPSTTNPNSMPSSSRLPPVPASAAPPTPPPLLDSTEQSLFSSFLTTLDVDPQFLFNPVLPPGMPSPPSQGLAQGEDAWRAESSERDRLGIEVGHMHLERRDESNPSSSWLSRRSRDPSEHAGDGHGPDGRDRPGSSGTEGAWATFRPPALPASINASTRRKSRSGGVSGDVGTTRNGAGGGKKPRTSPPPARDDAMQHDDGSALGDGEDGEEDTNMDDEDDGDYEERGATRANRAGATRRQGGGGLASTRSRRRPSYSTRTSSSSTPTTSAIVPVDSKGATTPAVRLPALVVPASRPSLSSRPNLPRLSSSSSSSVSNRPEDVVPAPPSNQSPRSTAPRAPNYATSLSKPAPRGAQQDDEPRPRLERPDSSAGPPPSIGRDLVAPALGATSEEVAPVALTTSQKRANHIQSEQRRRNAIKLGFRDLVELVMSGQALSGISLGGEDEDADGQEDEEPGEADGEDGEFDGGGTARGGPPLNGKRSNAKSKAPNRQKKKKKGTGRGRGRKGDTGANASKSVVLEQSRRYIVWLDRGNRAIEGEIARVEAILASAQAG